MGIKKRNVWLVGSVCLCLSLLAFVALAAPVWKEPNELTDISRTMPDLQFALIDDQGRAVTQRDYRGAPVLLFFGYTGCGDLCPATLQHLHDVLRKLPKDDPSPRILFVTLDPAHDTPEVLRKYVLSFDPEHITGITGSPRDLENFARRYRIGYRAENGDGTIPHSNIIYVFDAAGHARRVIMPDNRTEQITVSLKQLADAAR